MTPQVFALKLPDDLAKDKKNQNLWAERWLLYRLSAALSCAPTELSFRKGERGKPYLSSHPSLFFNLSHSGQWIVLALSNREVGIDVERLHRRNFRAIVRRFFHPAEIAFFDSVEEKDLQERFITHWTYKEAYLKLLGTGIGAQSLATHPILYSSDNGVEVPTHTSGKLFLKAYAIDPNYRCSLATEEFPPVNIQIDDILFYST